MHRCGQCDIDLPDDWPDIHGVIISKILSWVNKGGLSSGKGPNIGDKSVRISFSKALRVYLSRSSNIAKISSAVMAVC